MNKAEEEALKKNPEFKKIFERTPQELDKSVDMIMKKYKGAFDKLAKM